MDLLRNVKLENQFPNITYSFLKRNNYFAQIMDRKPGEKFDVQYKILKST